MAYSIQYGKKNKRKKRRDLSRLLALLLLLLAISVRILSNDRLDAVRGVLFGGEEAVEAFCEEFVKHEKTGLAPLKRMKIVL